jgi:3-hydroxypropionyl-CoA synthetase (ADP-forming)
MYENYGFRAPRVALARNADEAVTIAVTIGFPVVLKVVSAQIAHKTDVGGVALNLYDAQAVRDAFGRIIRSVQTACPDATIEGIEVQEMVTQGTEIIIGLLDDPQFGLVIMFGLGGVFTEVLEDVSFRVLPITREDAVEMLHETRGFRLLQGYRGQPPVSEDMLVDLLMNASCMGMDHAGKLESVDFNPIVVWDDQHRVLDAKILWHVESREVSEVAPANTAYLERFFKAQSVALVGASSTPGKVGHSVLDSLLNYEYQGRVFPINPTRDEIMGVKAYPSLPAISEPVELVVGAIDLASMPTLIEECAAKGVHNLVIVSGGGKELGGERAAVEAEVRRLVREHQVRVIGPNCIGVFDGHTRLDTFFQVQQRMVRPRAGRVSMLTQSGTVGVAFLEDAVELGVSKFTSYGNRTDVDEADLLTFLADDPETDVVALYVEGLEDGRKFLQAARSAALKKPVVVFKVGRTARAARASMSHTGYLGGSYGVVRGALRQAGLIAVDSYEELFAVTKALALQPRARGNRVAMISNGAGTMVQGIDLLPEYGLQIPDLSCISIQRLKEVYPFFYLVQNPIDVTGSASSSDYQVGIETILQDPAIDIVMPWFVFQDTPLGEDIVGKLAELNRVHDKPILAGSIGGPYTTHMARELEKRGIPVFPSVRQWIAAAGALAARGRHEGRWST